MGFRVEMEEIHRWLKRGGFPALPPGKERRGIKSMVQGVKRDTFLNHLYFLLNDTDASDNASSHYKEQRDANSVARNEVKFLSDQSWGLSVS